MVSSAPGNTASSLVPRSRLTNETASSHPEPPETWPKPVEDILFPPRKRPSLKEPLGVSREWGRKRMASGINNSIIQCQLSTVLPRHHVVLRLRDLSKLDLNSN